jgi:hypothetical protein
VGSDGRRAQVGMGMGKGRAHLAGANTCSLVLSGNNRAVLYVEDEEGDGLLMRMAFRKTGMTEALRLVGSGRAAIDYLAGAHSYGNRSEYPVPMVGLAITPASTSQQALRYGWFRTRAMSSVLHQG